MPIIGVDHVQVAAPPGSEDDARTFYADLLGLDECAKPAALEPRGGVWFEAGGQQLHVGIADPFVAASRAHPALRAAAGTLDELATRLREAGHTVEWDEQLAGVRRFYTDDPWGNRVELLEAREEPVRVVAHDPTWHVRFERERAQLQRVLAAWLTDGVHHVGSTAVPGLSAKPTIDVMAGVRSLEETLECFAPLAGLGYHYAPYRTDEMHWFCKPDPSRRRFHLHLVPGSSPRFHGTLAFRDSLRSDPALAARYAELKRSLARKFADDREAYTAGKASFVIEQTERALRRSGAACDVAGSGPSRVSAS